MKEELAGRRGTLVLGMHRSGTSATTRVLSILLAQSLSPLVVHSNPHGQWERLKLRPHLDRLLLKQSATWDCPPSTTVDWTTVSDQRAVTALRTLGDRNWVWKDPRLSLTLPFWLEHLDPEPRLVFVTRDPLEVAHSLSERDGNTVERNLALWEQTLRHLIHNLDGRKVFVVRFSELKNNPDDVVEQLMTWLGTAATGSVEEAAASIISPPTTSTNASNTPTFTASEELSSQQGGLVQYLERATGETNFELPLPPATPGLSRLLGKPTLSRRAAISLRDMRTRVWSVK